MDTLDLVAPAYREAASVIPIFDTERDSIAAIRDGIRTAYEQAYGSPVDVPREEVSIVCDGGDPVRALLYRPVDGTMRGGILHIHGGGWIAGSPDMLARFCADIADRHRVAVLSVAYRLVPEAPGDAALDDCFDALAWLRSEADHLGFNPDRIAVLGDSAGGNLAAGTALRARDAGIPLLAQLLMYPAFDDRTGGADSTDTNPFSGEFVLDKRYTHQLWTARLREAPLASRVFLAPARMENVSRVAPAFIATGSLDLLTDEAMTYATRLMHARVPTELHVYDGVFHAFNMLPGPETDAFKSDLARAIDRHFA